MGLWFDVGVVVWLLLIWLMSMVWFGFFVFSLVGLWFCICGFDRLVLLLVGLICCAVSLC